MKNCTSDNPVNTTIKVVGGKWKTLILWYLKPGPMRYSQLGRQITGVTQKMLTQQLREMELEGLIERKVYPVVPPKVEYSMTEYGRTLEPVLDALAQWGQKHKQRGL